MKPYVRVYDRAGSFAAVEFCNKKSLVADVQGFCETGVDRVIVMDAVAGGTVVMRLSDVVSIVDIDEEIMRKVGKQDAEEIRLCEEGKQEEEPSWK